MINQNSPPKSQDHHLLRHCQSEGLPRPASDVRRSSAAAARRRAASAMPWAPPGTVAGRRGHRPGQGWEADGIP